MYGLTFFGFLYDERENINGDNITDKSKEEFFLSVIETIDDKIEDWMGEGDKLKLITQKITEIIDYYSDVCFYLKKEDGSFQIGPSSGGLLPHRVDDDSLSFNAIVSEEDMFRSGEIEDDPQLFSEMAVVLYDVDLDVPKPRGVLYTVSGKREAFDKSDTLFIRDIFDRFLQ